ncbi:hypothetical protein SNE40_005884 [Patella caerulea]|uniref:SGNH hydrolase-type esterase domain-containing protein n=1 Tax=Patella caerulea TaxID=87958 RepID=A0AAN8K3M0_PATCE
MKKAATYARTRPGGLNLGLDRLNMNIWWQGYSGLKFKDLEQKLAFLLTIESTPPDILVIHCGGNDLGTLNVADFRRKIRTTFQFIINRFPNTFIVWSQILPRKFLVDAKALSKQRSRLNNFAAKRILELGGAYIRYPDIKFGISHLFQSDNIHLSDIGNSIFINTLQGALEHFYLANGNVYPF